MSSLMRAVVLDGRGGIDILEKAVPEPAPNEVVIRVESTGICGTDLHLVSGEYVHGRFPVTPGHEFAGRVSAIGTKVTRFTEGDFVGVDPNVSCGKCRWCRSGAKNLCETILPVGVSIDGSCADYVVVPADVTYRLSESFDAGAGALVEPLSCVLHAVERVPGWADQTMVIYGAGAIGLLAVAVARHLGATSIHVVEPHELRRARAASMGATSVAPSAEQLGELGNIDLALDASGNGKAIQSAIDTLGVRGRLIQMGVAGPNTTVSVSPLSVFQKEISIVGSNSLATSYPAAAEMMVDLHPTLAPMITTRVPLSEYARGVDLATSPTEIKVQVVPD
jgi:2-desacetyl-2-hydroxyethyl bacteriochlorophyllide A dehydrogenase